MNRMKQEIEAVFNYLLKFTKNPLGELKDTKEESLVFLSTCVLTANVLMILIGQLFNGTNLFVLRLELKYGLIFSVYVFGFSYLLKYAFQSDLFPSITEDLKNYIPQLFVKSQIITVVLSALMLQLFGYIFAIYNLDVLVFLITFVTILMSFQMNSVLKNNDRQLKYSLLIAVTFQLTLYLLSPQYNHLWLPQSHETEILEGLDFSKFEENREKNQAIEALAHGNDQLAFWLVTLSTQTDLALTNPVSFGKAVKNDPHHIYILAIQCIRFFAKLDTPRITEEMKKIMLDSKSKINNYQELQSSLSGRAYRSLTPDTLKQTCQV